MSGKSKKIVFLKISKSRPENGHKSAEKADFQKILKRCLVWAQYFYKKPVSADIGKKNLPELGQKLEKRPFLRIFKG